MRLVGTALAVVVSVAARSWRLGAKLAWGGKLAVEGGCRMMMECASPGSGFYRAGCPGKVAEQRGRCGRLLFAGMKHLLDKSPPTVWQSRELRLCCFLSSFLLLWPAGCWKEDERSFWSDQEGQAMMLNNGVRCWLFALCSLLLSSALSRSLHLGV